MPPRHCLHSGSESYVVTSVQVSKARSGLAATGMHHVLCRALEHAHMCPLIKRTLLINSDGVM